MKKVWIHILLAITVAAFLAGTTMLVIISRKARHEIACNNIQVSITDSLRFMNEEYAVKFLSGRGEVYVGKRILEIDLAEIEKKYKSQSCIDNCESWVTDDGVLHVSVTHKTPALRFQSGKKEFYTDFSGKVFTSPCAFVADVPVVSGDVSNAFDSKWIADMLALVHAINQDHLCAGRIKEYAVDTDGEVYLTLRSGTVAHVGLPGKKAEILNALDFFFKEIEPAAGKGIYKTINTKYKGQIVCRKEL